MSAVEKAYGQAPRAAPPLSLLTTTSFRPSPQCRIKPSPSPIHFSGFELGKTHTVTLVCRAVCWATSEADAHVQHLLNTGSERTRINIIPPTTPFFKIVFTKRVCMI